MGVHLLQSWQILCSKNFLFICGKPKKKVIKTQGDSHSQSEFYYFAVFVVFTLPDCYQFIFSGTYSFLILLLPSSLLFYRNRNQPAKIHNALASIKFVQHKTFPVLQQKIYGSVEKENSEMTQQSLKNGRKLVKISSIAIKLDSNR